MSRGTFDPRSLPGHADRAYLVMTPRFRVVWATEAYRRATLLWREKIEGRAMFDLFPDNPHDPSCDAVRSLRASLERVLESAAPDRMPLQRYDVRDHVRGDRHWIEKYWAPVNRPIFGRGSEQVAYLLHEVSDVSTVVQLRRALDEEAVANQEQQESVRQLLTDLRSRRRTLNAARNRLERASRGSHVQGIGPAGVVHDLSQRLGMGVWQPYLTAGDPAPRTGWYDVFHQHICKLHPHQVFVEAGTRLRGCIRCGDAVLYRLTFEHLRFR